MKSYLVIDEGISAEHNHSRIIKVWGHANLIHLLLSKVSTEVLMSYKGSGSYIELYLHPLADESDVSNIRNLVSSIASRIEDNLLLEDDSFWASDDNLSDDEKFERQLSGLGKILRADTPEARSELSTLLTETRLAREHIKNSATLLDDTDEDIEDNE